MMDVEVIPSAIAMVAKLAADMTEDGELTESELQELQEALETVEAAIEYQLDLIESGRQAAATQGREAFRKEI